MNIAIIGCGNIANFHAKAIQRIKGLNLIGAYSTNIKKTEIFAKKYKIKAFQNLEEILNNNKIEIITITTPNNTHGDIALKAIKYKKDTIIEKPIDIDLKKIKKIIHECKKNKTKITVISQKRFINAYQKIKKEVLLLDPQKIEITISQPRSKEYYNGWQGKKEIAGGGVLVMQGIHYIDLINWIFGPIEVTSAKEIHKYNLEIEDQMIINLKLKNNIPLLINLKTNDQINENKIIITTKEGEIIISKDRIIKWINKKHYLNIIINKIPKRIYYKQEIIKDLKKQIEIFIKEGNNEQNIPTAKDGLDNLKIIKSIYKSAQKIK